MVLVRNYKCYPLLFQKEHNKVNKNNISKFSNPNTTKIIFASADDIWQVVTERQPKVVKYAIKGQF